jgi:Holliday junction resolvase RusA-like endonuclease
MSTLWETPKIAITIRLPYLPPSEWNPNTKTHWRRRETVKVAVQDEIIVLVREQDWNQPPLPMANVKLTWTFPDNRRRDPDNLVAASKPIIDALTKARVIQDDSWQHMNLEIAWEKGDKAETKIEVSPFSVTEPASHSSL